MRSPGLIMTQTAETEPRSVLGCEWRVQPTDETLACSLAREISLPPVVAGLLVSRECRDPDQARAFLNPRLSDLSDPFALPDMRVAVDRIRRAMQRDESLVVFGDYDVDGVTATALLVQVLTRLGAKVSAFLPNRIDDGYGLGCEPLERCLKEHDVSLVLTVDCGTGSAEAVALATSRGVDVVVTDHHELAGEPAPAVAVVNPHRGTDEGMKSLAGVGVAFKLCHALVKAGLDAGEPAAKSIDLRAWLDLVAVGTVADVVPLTGENRILVRHGLVRLNATESVGLRALCEVTGAAPPLQAYHLGFVLGPRLNAAGRLGSARDSLDLLMTDDPEQATDLAKRLDRTNQERRRIEDEMLQSARGIVEETFDEKRDFGLVLGEAGWHIGTAGIVASRLVSRFYRPTVVVAFNGEDEGRGSCRSIEEIDLMAALEACRDELVTYGGHRMAAGLTLRRDRLDAFRRRFNEACAEQVAHRVVRPVQRADGWVSLGEMTSDVAAALGALRPFGVGNPTPVWGARQVRLSGTARTVGHDHLKFAVASGETVIDAIAFGLGGYTLPDGPMDVLFQLKEDEFRGRRQLQLIVRDFRSST